MKSLKNFPLIWFSAAVVLTTATQLRFSQFPIGPGEIMLVIWAMVSVYALLMNRRIFLAPGINILILFWIFAGFLFSVGILITVNRGLWNDANFHDLFAFLMVAVMVTLFTTKPNARQRAWRSLGFILSFAAVTQFLLLLYSLISPTLGPLKFWFMGVRFTGWAKNPNQIALLVCMIPFLGYYKFNHCEKLYQKIWYGFLIMASIPVGIATKSDGLTLSWAIGLLIMAALWWSGSGSQVHKEYWKHVWTYALLPLAVLVIAGAYGYPIYTRIRNQVISTYQERNQGSGRIMLWSHGLQAMSTSPLFGLGPGAFSGESGPLQGGESHNTFIEWGTSTGILGLIMYFGLFIWLISLCWVKKKLALFTGLISLNVYGSFHYIFRHPLYWFYILFIALVVS